MLRIGAILAVVVIHAIGAATRQSGTGWHSAWWWGADLVNAACLWCVPVFVMVSGALLLDPSRRFAGGEFLKRRALRIGVPLAFWIAVYLVFKRQFYGVDVTTGGTVKAVASGDPYLQLYFLYIVAGLTVLTPVLRKLIEHSSRRDLTILTGAALAFGLLEHAVRELGGGGGFNAVTRFLPYIGYYLAGHLLTTSTVTARTQRTARSARGGRVARDGARQRRARRALRLDQQRQLPLRLPQPDRHADVARGLHRRAQLEPEAPVDRTDASARRRNVRRLPDPPAAALPDPARARPCPTRESWAARCSGPSRSRVSSSLRRRSSRLTASRIPYVRRLIS